MLNNIWSIRGLPADFYNLKPTPPTVAILPTSCASSDDIWLFNSKEKKNTWKNQKNENPNDIRANKNFKVTRYWNKSYSHS